MRTWSGPNIASTREKTRSEGAEEESIEKTMRAANAHLGILFWLNFHHLRISAVNSETLWWLKPVEVAAIEEGRLLVERLVLHLLACRLEPGLRLRAQLGLHLLPVGRLSHLRTSERREWQATTTPSRRRSRTATRAPRA